MEFSSKDHRSIVTHALSGMNLYDPAFQTVSFTKYTSLTNCFHNSQYAFHIGEKTYSSVEEYMYSMAADIYTVEDELHFLSRALVHKFTQNQHCFQVLMSTKWGQILQDRTQTITSTLLMAVRNALHKHEELYADSFEPFPF
jgi:hypothetical protein